MSEQRCGNCEWFGAIHKRADGEWRGECLAPLPDSLGESPEMRLFMRESLGTACPCHKPKEDKADE